MRVTGITANLPVADIATASEFYREYLGLSVEAMNLGWVARYASADGRASVQLVTGDASAPQDSVISGPRRRRPGRGIRRGSAAWVRDRPSAHR
jgi:catechol 2,3-dioxygenase-like lactoylglutathione lyase family enzyme